MKSNWKCLACSLENGNGFAYGVFIECSYCESKHLVKQDGSYVYYFSYKDEVENAFTDFDRSIRYDKDNHMTIYTLHAQTEKEKSEILRQHGLISLLEFERNHMDN